jgi:hypothetical protein
MSETESTMIPLIVTLFWAWVAHARVRKRMQRKKCFMTIRRAFTN